MACPSASESKRLAPGTHLQGGCWPVLSSPGAGRRRLLLSPAFGPPGEPSLQSCHSLADRDLHRAPGLSPTWEEGA